MLSLKLRNSTRKETLATHVEKAHTLFTRMKGLLGRSDLNNHHTLWILNCNSIHTLFMKFPIDVIFVNKTLIVKSVYRNINPGRFIFPVWGASSVFEFSSKALKDKTIERGDQLDVGH